MTDVLDRMAAANPVREDGRPPIDDVWRKITADEAQAPRRPWRRRGGRALLIAAAVVPVVVVVLVAISTHAVRRTPPRPALRRTHHVPSTIDPAVQRSARQALVGRSGSIVVMNPQTGAIEAMAATGDLRGSAASVPPGATFDVVTLATALTSGRYGPDSLVSGASPLGSAGSQVRNDEGQSFGRLTLSDALTFSVNTVFARVGAGVGADALLRQMRLFRLSAARSGTAGSVAVAPLAAGQGSVTATPLELATIAAAIANGGRLAEPHATALTGPAPQRLVMSARTARSLTQMLRRVVTHGTATAANLPGLDIAGKTGTAPVGGAGRNHGTVASFIGFAPADHPTVAIAVVLAALRDGFGGTDAAPIAARVIGTVLRAAP
jgi:peptidoglycan glycosyltransferase